jgi:uncharacterized protein (DUF58 family)
MAETFPLIPRRRLIGLAFGGMHSARRGLGSDVAGSRPYRPGDDVDAIDWAASARLSLARGSDEFVVREFYAEEAPRVIALVDRRPAMSLFPPELPWLSKPAAIAHALQLISASAIAARAYVGYLDEADGASHWRPPRSQRPLEVDGRPFSGREDAVELGLHELGEHRRDVPAGTFVFVLSDFLAGPSRERWLRALERRWDIVPVAIQDPLWERSFPDVGDIVVPFLDRGRVVYARLTRAEAEARRAANERRWQELVRLLRSLDLDPVVVTSHRPADVSAAFLAWADRRMFTRGRR